MEYKNLVLVVVHEPCTSQVTLHADERSSEMQQVCNRWDEQTQHLAAVQLLLAPFHHDLLSFNFVGSRIQLQTFRIIRFCERFAFVESSRPAFLSMLLATFRFDYEYEFDYENDFLEFELAILRRSSAIRVVNRRTVTRFDPTIILRTLVAKLGRT